MAYGFTPFGFTDEDEEERRRREMEQARQVAGPVSPESMGNLGAPPPVAGTTPTGGMPPGFSAMPTQGPATMSSGLSVPSQISMYASTLGQQGTPEQVMAGAGNAQPGTQTFQPDAWNRFLEKQDNPQALIEMANDKTVPQHLRDRAGRQANDLLTQQFKQQEETQRVRDALATNPEQIAKDLRRGNDIADWTKLVLLSAFNAELAGDQAAKMGFGAKWVQSRVGDEVVNVKRLANGRVVEGERFDGTPLSQQELEAASGGIIDAKRPALQKGTLMTDEAGHSYQAVFNPDPKARPEDRIIYQPVANAPAKPTGRLTPADQSPVLSGQAAAASAGGRVLGGSFAQQTGQMPGAAVSALPGAPAPAAPAAAMPVAQQPAAAVRTGGMPAAGPVPPSAIPAAAPAAQAAAPVARPVVPTAGGPAVPAAPRGVLPPGEYELQQDIRKKAAGERIELSMAEPKENVKVNVKEAGDAAKRAQKAAREVGTVDRIIKATEEKPQFFNILGSDAYRAFVAASDPERGARLTDLAKVANIKPEDRTEFQKLMNDIRRLELAGITGSGLSATQLNTERESQRAVNAFAVSITDTAEAAKAQAMIAKAQIDYDRAWARFLADPKTNKQLSPAALQTQFDDTVGDKIWRDLAPKLEERIKRPEPGTGRTSTNVPFKIVTPR